MRRANETLGEHVFLAGRTITVEEHNAHQAPPACPFIPGGEFKRSNGGTGPAVIRSAFVGRSGFRATVMPACQHGSARGEGHSVKPPPRCTGHLSPADNRCGSNS